MFGKKRRNDFPEVKKNEIVEQKKGEVERKVIIEDELNQITKSHVMKELLTAKIDPYCPIDPNFLFDPTDIAAYQVNFAARTIALHDDTSENDEFVKMMVDKNYYYIRSYAYDCIYTMSECFMDYICTVIVNSYMNIINPIASLTGSDNLSLFNSIDFLGSIRNKINKEGFKIRDYIHNLICELDITVVEDEDCQEKLDMHGKIIDNSTRLIAIEIYNIVCISINDALDKFCFGDNQREVRFVYEHIVHLMNSFLPEKERVELDFDDPALYINMQRETKNWFLSTLINNSLKGFEKWLETDFTQEFHTLVISASSASVSDHVIKRLNREKFTQEPDVKF